MKYVKTWLIKGTVYEAASHFETNFRVDDFATYDKSDGTKPLVNYHKKTAIALR